MSQFITSPFIIVDDSNGDITYSGSWDSVTSTQNDSTFLSFQDSFHFTVGSASFSYPFNGTRIIVRGGFIGDNNASSSAQYPEIRVDDAPMVLNPSVPQNGGQWSASLGPFSSDHPHTLTIDTIGAVSADQQNFRIDFITYQPLQEELALDPTDIYMRLPNSTTENFNFDAGWLQPSVINSPMQTSTPNSTAYYTFHGTTITWWGTCFQSQLLSSTNAATAIYSIDGQPPVPFQIDDTSISGPTCIAEKILFQETSLPLGLHNLTVIYQGDKDKMLLSLNSIAYTAIPSPLRPSSPVASSTISRGEASTTPSAGATSPRPNSSTKIGIILGSVLGGFVFCCAFLAVVLVIQRRKRLNRVRIPVDINPHPILHLYTTLADSTSYSGKKGMRVPPQSVIALDYLSSPNSATPRPTPSETFGMSRRSEQQSAVESIRRARQQQLNDRMRAVQQEVMALSSDLSIAEKEGGGGEALTRARTINRCQQVAGGEEEMTIDELKEQLRLMTEQVIYLQEQQRSAWALGLSDDPPPGYTPVRTRHSQSPSIYPVA